MNLLHLAKLQVAREGKLNFKNISLLILDRAITIRKWLDIQERNKKVAISRYRK